MLLWDLATDRVEGGQWLSGRVDEDKCDVSPDGQLFVYFGGKFKPQVDTFTAISRPPNFTALAFWPARGTYGGGGVFETNRRVVLEYGRVDFELHSGTTLPRDFEVIPVTDRRGRQGSDATDLRRHGFTLVQRGTEGTPTASMRVVFDEPWVEEKTRLGHGGMALQRLWHGMFERNGQRCVYSYRLATSVGKARRATTVDLGRLDWADWDHDGSLIYSTHGQLYRRDVSQALHRPLGALPEPKLVADLSPMTFKAIPPPPEATRWPGGEPRRGR